MKMINIFAAICIIFLTSCGTNTGGMGMANLTQVELGENNFRNLGSVAGEASSNWILFFGPLGKEALMAEAKADLLKNAKLTGSQALVNMTWDSKLSTIFGIFTTKTLYVTADIVEFQ